MQGIKNEDGLMVTLPEDGAEDAAQDGGLTVVKIIMLSGGRGAGKDTLADALVDRCGYTRMSFADPLRELACRSYGLPMQCFIDRQAKDSPLIPELAARVASLPGIPARPTPRDVLIALGDSVRGTMGTAIFVASLAERIADDIEAGGGLAYAVPDHRLPIECDLADRVNALLEMRGSDALAFDLQVRIEREGHGNAGLTHATDCAMRDMQPDMLVRNNSGVDDLAASAQAVDGHLEDAIADALADDGEDDDCED